MSPGETQYQFRGWGISAIYWLDQQLYTFPILSNTLLNWGRHNILSIILSRLLLGLDQNYVYHTYHTENTGWYTMFLIILVFCKYHHLLCVQRTFNNFKLVLLMAFSGLGSSVMLPILLPIRRSQSTWCPKSYCFTCSLFFKCLSSVR